MIEDTLQKEMKWLRSPIKNYTGSLNEMYQYIPEFKRTSFSGNQYLDVIEREPLNNNETNVSVGVVSKQYQLVQHTHIYKKALKAVQAADINIDDVSAQMSLTEYGERMALIIELPETMQIDPGDDYATAFVEISAEWQENFANEDPDCCDKLEDWINPVMRADAEREFKEMQASKIQIINT